MRSLSKKGKFREDLYYRLNTVPIKVPALHERREDIYMLFRRFALDFGEKYNTKAISIDADARLIIENYRWPGNVRELKNIVEPLSVLAETREVDALALLDISPHLNFRNLPSIAERDNKQSGGLGDNYEREILYKLLFDMRNDMTDMKKLIFEMIRMNNLNVPEKIRTHSTKASNSITDIMNYPSVNLDNMLDDVDSSQYNQIYDQESSKPHFHYQR